MQSDIVPLRTPKGFAHKMVKLKIGKVELLFPRCREKVLSQSRFRMVTAKRWGNRSYMGHLYGWPFGLVYRNN